MAAGFVSQSALVNALNQRGIPGPDHVRQGQDQQWTCKQAGRGRASWVLWTDNS